MASLLHPSVLCNPACSKIERIHAPRDRSQVTIGHTLVGHARGSHLTLSCMTFHPEILTHSHCPAVQQLLPGGEEVQGRQGGAPHRGTAALPLHCLRGAQKHHTAVSHAAHEVAAGMGQREGGHLGWTAVHQEGAEGVVQAGKYHPCRQPDDSETVSRSGGYEGTDGIYLPTCSGLVL